MTTELECVDGVVRLKHDALLRLIVLLRYGIKNLKGIGEIDSSDSRPNDNRAERGYGWSAGF